MNMLCFAKSRRLHTCDYIHMKKIFVALTCSMATFNDSSKEKKNEMAREQRGKYIYIYIYDGTTTKKKHNKQ